MKEETSEPTVKFPPAPAERPPCPGNCKPHECPNMACIQEDMRGERYRCTKCGEGFYLDYEEMK